MKTRNMIIAGLVATAGIALAAPFVAHAGGALGSGGPKCEMAERGGHPGMHGDRHGDRMSMGGHGMLRGLNLTTEQEDRIFELRHEQAPKMRAKWKDVRASREALHALAFSGEYTEAKAQQLSVQAAQAMADIAAMRARLQAGIFEVLTEEQREMVKARQGQRRAMADQLVGEPNPFGHEGRRG